MFFHSFLQLLKAVQFVSVVLLNVCVNEKPQQKIHWACQVDSKSKNRMIRWSWLDNAVALTIRVEWIEHFSSQKLLKNYYLCDTLPQFTPTGQIATSSYLNSSYLFWCSANIDQFLQVCLRMQSFTSCTEKWQRIERVMSTQLEKLWYSFSFFCRQFSLTATFRIGKWSRHDCFILLSIYTLQSLICVVM